MAKRVKITEITPEANALAITPEQEEKQRTNNKLKSFVAGIDRELQRINVENCVRLGDTVINEVNLIDSVKASLEETKAYYLTLITE